MVNLLARSTRVAIADRLLAPVIRSPSLRFRSGRGQNRAVGCWSLALGQRAWLSGRPAGAAGAGDGLLGMAARCPAVGMTAH